MESTCTALKGLTRLAANSGAPDHSCDDFLGRESEERKPPDGAEGCTPQRKQYFPCWPCHVEPLEQTLLFVRSMYVVQGVVFIAPVQRDIPCAQGRQAREDSRASERRARAPRGGSPAGGVSSSKPGMVRQPPGRTLPSLLLRVDKDAAVRVVVMMTPWLTDAWS